MSDAPTVLTVSLDEPEVTAAFLAQHGWSLPVVWDETGAAFAILGDPAIPRTLAISRTGVIIRDLLGAQSVPALQDAIEAAKR